MFTNPTPTAIEFFLFHSISQRKGGLFFDLVVICCCVCRSTEIFDVRAAAEEW
jgi:hypothetical protein